MTMAYHLPNADGAARPRRVVWDWSELGRIHFVEICECFFELHFA